MGKALYRSYRARKFEDVIGQEHITKTLVSSLKQGRQSHAYLLTGPRGVGKTSVARILAHEVNNLPYESEQPPIDIIEIDAASNRRIDEIRDIKEKVNIAPVQARYKVYIIDEVHMLTRESFNALLKTLEEPPKHVIFILATTELYKLPETIISRCIHFPFKPIGKDNVVKHLKTIAKLEKIQIDDGALELIAEHGGGSFRDSISLLDQIRSFGAKITVDDVRHTLGLAPDELIAKIEQAVDSSDMKALTELLEALYEFGADAVAASKQLLESVRARLLRSEPLISASFSINLMERLLAVQASANPKRELELVLIGAVIDNPAYLEPKTTKPTPVAAPEPEAQPPSETDTSQADLWEKTLQELKKANNTLYSIARMADYEVGDSLLTLRFKFPFHQKQVAQAKNLSAINSIVGEISGGKYQIKVDKADLSAKQKPAPKQTAQSPAGHKNISNIFGSSEVLES